MLTVDPLMAGLVTQVALLEFIATDYHQNYVGGARLAHVINCFCDTKGITRLDLTDEETGQSYCALRGDAGELYVLFPYSLPESSIREALRLRRNFRTTDPANAGFINFYAMVVDANEASLARLDHSRPRARWIPNLDTATIGWERAEDTGL